MKNAKSCRLGVYTRHVGAGCRIAHIIMDRDGKRYEYSSTPLCFYRGSDVGVYVGAREEAAYRALDRGAQFSEVACLVGDWGLDGYVMVRANGMTKDSPRRPFPHDGIYAWEDQRPTVIKKIKKWSSTIRYTEGPGDRAWMEERDRNYLARLARGNIYGEEEQRDADPSLWTRLFNSSWKKAYARVEEVATVDREKEPKVEVLESAQLQLAIQLSLFEPRELEESRELFGLQVVYFMPHASGDCLFEAIAAFDVVGRNWRTMRALAVEQIRHDEQLQGRIVELVGIAEHRLLVGEGDGVFANVDDYLHLMGLQQTWGTEVELVALARALRCPVVILTPGNRGDLIFESPDYDMAHPIFLNYAHGNHYAPLMITEGHNALEILAGIRARIAARAVIPAAVYPGVVGSSSGISLERKELAVKVKETEAAEKSSEPEKHRSDEGQEIALARQRELQEAQARAEREVAEKAAVARSELRERCLRMAADSSEMPLSFRCSITRELMKDPVSDVLGHTYERVWIQDWFDKGHRTDPNTGQKLESTQLTPNWALKKAIDEWLENMVKKFAAADSAVGETTSSATVPSDRVRFFPPPPRDADRGGPVEDFNPKPK